MRYLIEENREINDNNYSYQLRRQICCYPHRELLAVERRQQDPAVAACCLRRLPGTSGHR